MPWIAVDPGTGELSIIYYALDAPTGFSTNTYMAYSTDGGTSFTSIRASSAPHTTASIPGWGGGLDYIGIAARSGRVIPIWPDDRSGTWQLYAAPLKYYSVVGPALICASSPTKRYVLVGSSVSNSQPAGSTVAWSTSPAGYFTPAGGAGPDFLTTLNNITGVGTITATVTLACGTSFTVSEDVRTNTACRGVASTYPNPTDKALTLEVPGTESAAAKGADERHTAQLYNQQGRLERRVEWQGSQSQLDTSTLPNGLYYLLVQSGTVTERQSILVQH